MAALERLCRSLSLIVSEDYIVEAGEYTLTQSGAERISLALSSIRNRISRQIKGHILRIWVHYLFWLDKWIMKKQGKNLTNEENRVLRCFLIEFGSGASIEARHKAFMRATTSQSNTMRHLLKSVRRNWSSEQEFVLGEFWGE